MSKYPITPAACIEKFITDLSAHNSDGKIVIEELLTQTTIDDYASTVKTIVQHLIDGGRDALPHKITEDDVRWLIGVKWANLAVKTKKVYRSVLARFTRHYNNDIVPNVKVRFPRDNRPNVRRLSDAQANALWSLPMNPMQRLVIHLEMFMGWRRCEILRFLMKHINGDILVAIGKGPIGGKPRIVSCHKDTPRILHEYLLFREEQIAIVKKKRPNAVIPDEVIIYRRANGIHAYTETGLDRAVTERLSKAVGFKFSNHDLRRTFARRLYKTSSNPNKLKILAHILGHENVSETEKYIGILDNDMADEMANLGY